MVTNLTPSSKQSITEKDSLPLLIAEDIIKVYKTGRIETQALRGVSFKVHSNEKLFIIGPSGSGKTTLVNIVAGMAKPTSGKVFWKDLSKDITRSSLEEIVRARRNFAGVIFQDSKLLTHLTVKENIELAGFYAKIPHDIIKQRSEFLMKFMNIWEKRNKRENTLSGGEKKRAAIATTLITNPKILIGDEPTGDLDIITAESILNLFDRIKEELGISICIVTHSQQVAARADRILEMRDGIVIGQHNGKIHLRELETSRLSEVDRQNRLALPKSILESLNHPKHFSVTVKEGKVVLDPIYDARLANKDKSDVTTCSMCGKMVDNDTKFCLHCGAAIMKKEEKK